MSVPVAHVWFAYGIPNKMSIVLDISHKKLLSVIYYTRYMVVEVEKEKRKDIIEKAAKLKEEEFTDLENQLQEELKLTEEMYAAQLKELKEGKDKGNDFKVSNRT